MNDPSNSPNPGLKQALAFWRFISSRHGAEYYPAFEWLGTGIAAGVYCWDEEIKTVWFLSVPSGIKFLDNGKMQTVPVSVSTN